jgi:hypothetical protein
MYDSDEVRDKVRQEMLGMALSPAASVWQPSPEERAALADARVALSRELQAVLATLGVAAERADRLERLRAVVQAWASEFVLALEESLRPLLERLAAALEAVGGRFRELAEAIGLLEEADAPEPFPWQKRPRVPDVRAARSVDAVAAGRHPAMTMRTRIRGGRR